MATLHLPPSGDHGFNAGLYETKIGAHSYPCLKALAKGPVSSDTDTLISRLRTEILFAKGGYASAGLSSDDYNAARTRLGERKVSQGLIVLGWIFFVLIIPAVLAFQASKTNDEIDKQMQSLAELSLKLKKLQSDTPENRLKKHLSECDQLRAELTKLQSRDVTSLGEEQQMAHATKLSKIESDLISIKAQIHSLVETHAELKSKVPSGVLPDLPSDLLAETTKAADDLRLAVSTGLTKDPTGLSTPRVETGTTAIDLTGSSSTVRTSATGGVLVPSTRATIAAAGRSSQESATQARDLGIEREQAAIRANVPKLRTGSFGIYNGHNTCYMASVIQSLRWNPVARYLINREIPEETLSGYSSETGEAVFTRDTAVERANRLRFQAALRGIIRTLDGYDERDTSTGQIIHHPPSAVSREQINRFRAIARQIDPLERWDSEQKDAQEFQTFLEDVLNKKVIADPATGQCFTSGFCEELSISYEIEIDPAYVRPEGGAEGALPVRYLASTKREDIAMHDISLDASNPAEISMPSGRRVDRAVGPGFNQARLVEKMGFSSGPANYMVARDATGEVADALRARVNKTARLDDADRAELGTAIVQFNAGVDDIARPHGYRIGRCHKTQRPLNNPPSITAYANRSYYDGRFPEGARTRRMSGVFAFPDVYERPDAQKPGDPSAKVRYELTSCVCHSGDGEGGHYFSYVKIDGRWYQFNDSSVTLAPGFNPQTDPHIYVVQYTKNTA